MGSAALTGNDVAIVDARILRDFADGDTVVLDFPNNLAETVVGKNGNMVVAYNAGGKTVNVTMRILRGSSDDKYLQGRLQEYINDPAANHPFFFGVPARHVHCQAAALTVIQSDQSLPPHFRFHTAATDGANTFSSRQNQHFSAGLAGS